MSIIKELWHGNVNPLEDARNNSKEMKERVGRAMRNEYATVERNWSEYMSLAEAAIFEYALKHGAKLTLETIE